MEKNMTTQLNATNNRTANLGAESALTIRKPVKVRARKG